MPTLYELYAKRRDTVEGMNGYVKDPSLQALADAVPGARYRHPKRLSSLAKGPQVGGHGSSGVVNGDHPAEFQRAWRSTGLAGHPDVACVRALGTLDPGARVCGSGAEDRGPAADLRLVVRRATRELCGNLVY